MDIRNDRQKGLSYMKVLQIVTKPTHTLSEPKPIKLDPYGSHQTAAKTKELHTKPTD